VCEWLLFRRRRGFPCAACSIAFICCGPQFRPKALHAAYFFPFFRFYVPRQQYCFFSIKQIYSFVCLEATIFLSKFIMFQVNNFLFHNNIVDLFLLNNYFYQTNFML